MDKFEQRHALFEQRHALFEKRQDRLDHQLQVMAKLVQAGIVMVRQLAVDTRELKKFQKAFLASYKNGGNGRSRQ